MVSFFPAGCSAITTIKLGADHAYAFLFCGLLAFFSMAISMFVLKVRLATYNSDILKIFKQSHSEFTGEPHVGAGGYPDMGDGRYSKKLSYEKWLNFAKYQIIHYNFIESMVSIIVLTIIGSLMFPKMAAVGAFLYFLGRIFCLSYLTNKGAQNPLRLAGSILGELAILLNFVLSVGVALNISCVLRI